MNYRTRGLIGYGLVLLAALGVSTFAVAVAEPAGTGAQESQQYLPLTEQPASLPLP